MERLHVLLELEQAGSLAKAAAGDEVRQSQYSRQLKQLSEYFGIPVTERHGRELKLTKAGKRLALLARESFTGLTDFQRECNDQPLALTIGAGDSLLQWVVLPRLGDIQKRVRNVQITLRNLRNNQIADGLKDLTLEFGLIREGTVPSRHRKERLLQLSYSIFLPRTLLPAGKPDHKRILRDVPLVHHNPAGELAQQLRAMADKEGLKMNFCVTCESFPQACRAIQSGQYAAILPTIAADDLPRSDFSEVEWPALKSETRWISLAANPRMVQLRPALEKVEAVLKTELKAR